MSICGHCGTALGARAWGDLELVDQVSQGQLKEHVTSWPADARIEVRRCGRCGSPLARTVSAASASAKLAETR
jgi:hypothetical protein